MGKLVQIYFPRATPVAAAVILIGNPACWSRYWGLKWSLQVGKQMKLPWSRPIENSFGDECSCAFAGLVRQPRYVHRTTSTKDPGSCFLAHAHVLEILETMTPSVLLRQDLKLKSLVLKATARLEFWSLAWSSSRYGSVQSDCVMKLKTASLLTSNLRLIVVPLPWPFISIVMFWCYHCHYCQSLVFWGPLLLLLVCLCFQVN
jgi:hypothetical protein